MITRNLLPALALTLPAGLAFAVPTAVTVPNHSFEERINPASPIFEDPSVPLTAFGKGIDRYNKWNGESWRHFEVDNNGGPLRIWNIGDPNNAAHIGTQGIADVGFGGNAPDGDLVVVVRSRYNDNEYTVDDPQTPENEAIRDFEAAVQVLDNELFDSTKRYVLSAEVGRLPSGAGEGGSANYTPLWYGGSLMFAVGGTNIDGATFAGRVDGGTIIGQEDTMSLAPNTWTTSTVTIEPDAANAIYDGLPIQIRLAALEDPADHALTQWAAWDNVSLTMEEIAGIPADLSGDGDVDDEDLGLFFSAFTGPDNGPSPNPAADLSGDGDVDDEDLGQAFSAFTGPLGPANVPEPTSLALLGLGGLLAARRRRA